MYSRMEYLLKCFNKSSGWNIDNFYDNILATSDALIDFHIPNGSKLEISSQATPHSASFMTLSNRQAVTGLMAYLYSSIPIKNASGTKDILLQDTIAGFQLILPIHLRHQQESSDIANSGSLLYGKYYYPVNAVEAMFIKRMSPEVQLLIKCVSNPRLYNRGTMIVYHQKNTPNYSREFIYSTNESLIGFRGLYNLFIGGDTDTPESTYDTPNFDNSIVSTGIECWYAAKSMSPGASLAVRYYTRSTSTGKPLTMSGSVNPLLGHVSMTYNVKTSVASTVCSKYDFNWFTYASNISMGLELFNFSKQSPFSSRTQPIILTSVNRGSFAPGSHSSASTQPVPANHPYFIKYDGNSQQYQFESDTDNSDWRFGSHADNNDLHSQDPFQDLVRKSNFSSVIKALSSLNDRMVKLLWIGRYKNILVSSGVKLRLNAQTSAPELGRFGVSLTYGC